VQLPGEYPQDEFLLVTKHHCGDSDRALHDAVCSIILAHCGDLNALSELGPDDIERVRAQAPHALN
jgi:hypothetical protein